MKNRDSSHNLQYQWTRGILKEKNEYVCFVYIFRNIYINVCIHKILNMNFSCLLEQKNMSRSNKPVLTIHPGIFFQQNISTRKFLKCQVGEGFPNCSHLPAVCGYWSWWCFLKLHLTSKRVGPETTSRRACESVGGHWWLRYSHVLSKWCKKMALFLTCHQLVIYTPGSLECTNVLLIVTSSGP